MTTRQAAAGLPPYAALENGVLKASLALPDPNRSYYQALRFEPALVTGIDYQDHHYFAEFVRPRDGKINDSLSGTADEYNTPLGYDEAQPGGEFIKIGVGILLRDSEKPYSSFRPYPVRSLAEYTAVDQGPAHLELLSEVVSANGHGYRLRKRFELDGNRLREICTLTNLGTHRLVSRQYCHNFTLIDEVPAAPGAYRTCFRFPLEIAPETNGRGDWSGDTVTSSGEVVFLPLQNFPREVRYNYAEILQTASGRGLRISGDFELEHVAYFSTENTVCPELFKGFDLAPGETDRWTREIEFF